MKKKKTCPTVNFTVPAKREMSTQILPENLKKLWNMNVTVILIINGALGIISKGLVKKQEEIKIRGRVKTIQTIINISQNTEKSPEDLRRLSIIQNAMEKHQIIMI